MIRSTFQLAPGIGPYRERQLWESGIGRWEDFPPEPALALSRRLDPRLRQAIAAAREALAAGDADRLAEMLPRRERWRLCGVFAEEAGFLDIETDGGDTVTAVGILDRSGPRVFLRGRDLEAFPEATRGWKLLVTFNGLSFDEPILRRAFPRWQSPLAHVDLRHLYARLGHRGGLKAVEREVGVARPGHLDGVDGWEAVRLWRRHLGGDRDALRRLAEYNLYDAVGLRPLMALGYNRLVERHGLVAEPLAVSHLGDLRGEVTKALSAL